MTSSPGTSDRAAWLKGGDAHCNVPPNAPARTRRLAVLGAPGAGKSTQADLLARRLGTCHLATGDVFRDAKQLNACDCSPTMIHALEYVRIGKLVPDEIIENLLSERSRCLRCKGGFVLDGFPRTRPQAEGLDKLLASQDVRLDAVLRYELPLDKIVARLSGRSICAGCHAIFNVNTRPPQQAGVCDHCGSKLCQRDDDRPELIRRRIAEYEENADALADFYRQKGILLSVNAEGSPEEIFDHTLGALQKRQS